MQRAGGRSDPGIGFAVARRQQSKLMRNGIPRPRSPALLDQHLGVEFKYGCVCDGAIRQINVRPDPF